MKGKGQTLKSQLLCCKEITTHQGLLWATRPAKLQRCVSHYSAPPPKAPGTQSRIKNGKSKSLRAEAPEEGPVTQSNSRAPYRQRFAVLRTHTHDHFHVPLCGLVVLVKVAL